MILMAEGWLNAVGHSRYIIAFVAKDQNMLNKIKFALVGSIAAAAMTAGAAQAATETVGADAEIIEAVTLANVVDLDFGTIASDATGGTASVTADAAGTRACGTMTCVGTASSGSIDVTAASGQTVDVSFATAGAVTLNGPGGATMSMTPSLSTGSFTSTGTDTVYVGGSLTVGASQAAGAYSATFDVDVDYQ